MTYRLLVSAIFFCTVIPQLFAATIVDTFFPGSGYDPSGGYTVSTATSLIGAQHSRVQSFVASESGRGGLLEIAIGYISGNPDFYVSLADERDNPLGVYSLSAVSGFGGNTFLSTAIDGPYFFAGETYLIHVYTMEDGYLAWNIGQNGQGAIRIDAVPEPASISAILIGSLFLVRRRTTRLS